MRTTVEIPDPLYRRLRAEAGARGLRGFSSIVVEALSAYLDVEGRRQELVDALEGARGSWSDDDVAEWEQARQEAWAAWRPDLSSTRTS